MALNSSPPGFSLLGARALRGAPLNGIPKQLLRARERFLVGKPGTFVVHKQGVKRFAHSHSNQMGMYSLADAFYEARGRGGEAGDHHS